MSFDDAEKIVESGKKNPLKTVLIILVALGLASLFTAVGTIFSETIKQIFFRANEKQETISKTEQSTMGNHSPTISAGGNVIITYGRDTIKEWSQVNTELLRGTQEGERYTEQELKRKITEIYQRLYDTLPQEAEERASQFLSTLSLRQEQLSDKHKRQTEFLESLPGNLSKTFAYIVQYIDTYVTELEKKSDIMTFEKVADIGPVVVSSNRTGYLVRVIHFASSKFVKVIFVPGEIRSMQAVEYPELAFQGYFLNGKSIEDGEFKVWRMSSSGFGGGWEVQYQEDGTMNESTKEHLKNEFDKFLDRVIAAKN
jgi:hypothetical protein